MNFWQTIPPDLPEAYDTILGFNEPDHAEHPLTPQRAMEGWVMLQEAYPNR